MSDAERQELRAKCKAATPGPWKQAPAGDAEYVQARQGSVDVADCGGGASMWESCPDAAYIAAANPKAIEALLDERDALALERETANIERERYLKEIKSLADEVKQLKARVDRRCECGNLVDDPLNVLCEGCA